MTHELQFIGNFMNQTEKSDISTKTHYVIEIDLKLFEI